MPWYKITVVNDADVELKTGLLFDAMEAAWLVDQAPDAALYRSSSKAEHLFFVSPALAQNAKEPLSQLSRRAVLPTRDCASVAASPESETQGVNDPGNR